VRGERTSRHVTDTFVADGRDGDLFFCFIALWLRTRALCIHDHGRRFRWNESTLA